MAGVLSGNPRHPLRSLALSAVLALAACEYPTDDATIARHSLAIERHTVRMEVPLASTARRIDATTAASLDRFFDGYVHARGDDLRIMTPPGAASGARSAIARAIRDRAVRRGIDGSTIVIAAAKGGVGAGRSYRVEYLRHSIPPRICGDWSESLEFNPRNRVHPNFGCASQGFVGAMVAHPADLVTARRAGPRDAARSNAVINNYRRGEATAVKRNPGEETIRTQTNR